MKKKQKKIKKEKKERKLFKGKKLNLNDFIGGIFVGIANIIPGVSGGTMLVIFNLFDRLMYAISDIFKRKTTTRKESFMLLLKVLIGAALGIIVFAKILGFTLEHLEAETILWFMGLILFSVPIIYNKELKDEKFNVIFFLIGVLIIGLLQYLKMKNPTNDTNDTMSLYHILTLIVCGIISGATMIFPGVSGSMVLLVLGKYEMIRSYIDKLTSLNSEAFISLCIFGIGAVLGIILSAKLTSFLLRKYKGKTMSLILGFIIASALILPFNIENSFDITTARVCSLIASFILGGCVIYYINLLQQKKEDQILDI
jgi:putative membrane protein